jgi:hypothetical protein
MLVERTLLNNLMEALRLDNETIGIAPPAIALDNKTDYDAVPLRTPQQLRQMDPRKIIVLVSSAPPFELERVVYHDDRPYRQALEEVRFKSVSVPELEPYADAGGGLATAVVPASGGNNVSATPRAAIGSSQATKASAEPSLDVIERQADTPTVPVTRQSKPVRVGRVGNRQLANDSRIPCTPTTSAGSLPIEVALTAQIDAGAAAFRQVMEGLPYGGEHDELIDQLQQITTLHDEFGDDDRIFE